MSITLYDPKRKAPHAGISVGATLLPTDYLFELVIDGKVTRSVTLPIGPQSIQIQRPGATTIEYTLGHEPIREHVDYKRANITIAGRSGLEVRAGHDATGGIVSRTGYQLVELFDRFLSDAQHAMHHRYGRFKVASGYVSHATDAYLVFRAYPLGLAVKVEVLNWSLQRDTGQTRFGYAFNLQLQAYAPATTQALPSLLSSVSNASRAAVTALQAASNYGAVAETALRAVGHVGSDIRAPIIELGRTVQQLARVTRLLGQVSDLPAATLRDVARVCRQTQAAWAGLVQSREELVDGSERSWQALQRDFGAVLQGVQRTNAVLAGYVSQTTPGALIDPLDDGSAQLPAPTRQAPTLRGTPIGDGDSVPTDTPVKGIPYVWSTLDSLVQVAGVLLGDVTAVTDLVQLNGLLDPYTKGDGSPLSPGDVIVVPTADTPEDSAGGDLYLTDIAITDDGDIRINGDTNDCLTASGAVNIRQALRLRSLTVAGDAPYFPAYGMPDLLGAPNGAGMSAYLAGQIDSQYRRDLRVADIEDVSIVDGGDRLLAEVSVRVVAATSAVQIVTPLT